MILDAQLEKTRTMRNDDVDACQEPWRDGERLTMKYGAATARAIGMLLYVGEDLARFERAIFLKAMWIRSQQLAQGRTA